MVELDNWHWAVGATALIATLTLGGWLSRRREVSSDQASGGQQREATTAAVQDTGDNEPITLQQQLEAGVAELNQLREQLDASTRCLQEAREENQSTKRQLTQLQNELVETRQADATNTVAEEIQNLRQQLQTRERDLKEARAEAELTLLQLHQVQEELEHYFLEGRDLKQKLKAVSTITPEQQEKLKRIRQRLLALYKSTETTSGRTDPSVPQERLISLVKRQQKALLRFQSLTQAT